MLFKIIKATFEVKSESFGYDFLMEIERKRSGASKYGDQSAHTLNLYEAKSGKWLEDKLFDTRYDRVPLTKKEWVKTWKNYIFNNWCDVSSIELVEYHEDIIEVED